MKQILKKSLALLLCFACAFSLININHGQTLVSAAEVNESSETAGSAEETKESSEETEKTDETDGSSEGDGSQEEIDISTESNEISGTSGSSDESQENTDSSSEANDAKDYSELISYNVSYSDDNSTATVVFTLDTEDENVYLDLKNADDEAFQELYERGKLAVNEEQTSYKTLAFDIAESGEYAFTVGVYSFEDESELAAKDFNVSIDLTGEGSTDGEYDAEETRTFTISVGQKINLWPAGIDTYGWPSNEWGIESFTSSNPDIVDATWWGQGFVTGVREGTATVTLAYHADRFGPLRYYTWNFEVVSDTVTAFVYLNEDGLSDEALYSMGIDPSTGKDGSYPVGQITLPKSYFEGKDKEGSALLNSDEDWAKIKEALAGLDTSTLSDAYAGNKENTITNYLNQVIVDLDQHEDSGYTSFSYYPNYSEGVAGFDDKYVKYHINLRFNTSMIAYMTGNNGITDGAAKDGSLLTSSKFIVGSPAEGLTPDEELAIVPDGYKLIGFYKDAKLTQRWFPSLESISTNQVVFVKFMKTPIATVNYVAVSDEIVSDEMGSISLESESFDVDDEEPVGSIATPKKGYVFTGWYSDEACTEKVSSNVEYRPTDLLRAEKTYTYYAKFEAEPEKSTFTVDKLDNVIFNGEVQKQSPVIRDANNNVVSNDSFDISYLNDKGRVGNCYNVGTYTVSVKPKEDSPYKGDEVRVTYQILKRRVVITSGSSSKTYDGRALTDSTIIFENNIGFIGDNVTAKAVGTITDVGEAANTIEIDEAYWTDYSPEDYEIVKNEGSLKVTKADGLDISTESGKNIIWKMYDGSALSEKAVSATEGTTIEYSTDGVTWTKEAPSITDVGTLAVMARASNPNYKDVTIKYTLMVGKRHVNITSADDTKTCDGQALTNPALTYEDDIGFVDGEAEARATGSITNVGETSNTIEITYYDGYKEGNYLVTTREGTLTVNEAEVSPTPGEKSNGKPTDTPTGKPTDTSAKTPAGKATDTSVEEPTAEPTATALSASTQGSKNAKTSESTKSTQTGDSSMTEWLALLGIGFGGILLLQKYRRRKAR